MKRLSLPCLILLLLSGPACLAEFKTTGVPRYDAAVKSAVGYIKQHAADIDSRETSLIAYTLVKVGEPATSPIVTAGVHAAIERANKGHGSEGYEHIYLAGVDAMLLADVDPDGHLDHLQKIADYVASAQQPDGSWAGSAGPGDTSMNQYGMLALWAANRAGCNISPQVVDRAAQWHLKFSNSDGGWGYRPPSSQGSGGGNSTHNCTMAGAGSLGIARMLLFGPKTKPKTEVVEETAKFGVLEKVVSDEPKNEQRAAFANYNASVSAGTIDSRVERAFGWATTRFHPEGHALNQKQYFFYALERAAALFELKQVQGKDWFTAYADVLLTLQSPDGGFEKTNTSPRIGACFAILYLARSTQQFIDKQFGKGSMTGSRGDLDDLYGDKKKIKKELGPLDELLGAMMTNVGDLDKLEDDLDDVVEKIQVSNREELVVQVDMLKKLLESRSADNRRTAYWALGRTGDFALIPLMMQGLRDPSVDCNLEALRSLRFIARKPNGFGLSLNPLTGAETADDERKVEVANQWRTKAYNIWGDWYRTVRPYEEGGGIDELELTSQGRAR